MRVLNEIWGILCNIVILIGFHCIKLKFSNKRECKQLQAEKKSFVK
jgi:hypothetical protein